MVIVIAYFIVTAKQLDGFHYNIVKVNCIRGSQMSLIKIIYTGNTLAVIIVADCCGKLYRSDKPILGRADSILNKPRSKRFIVDTELLHAGYNCALRIVAVIDGKSGAKPRLIGMTAKNTQTDRMKCPRKDIRLSVVTSDKCGKP